MAKEWEGKDCVERPSMPEYRQRELKLFMDDYKSNELLRYANPNIMWDQGNAETSETFTEKDYAVAWRKDVDWNLDFARRNPTVFQEFPQPYSEEQLPKDQQESFPDAVTNLKYGSAEKSAQRGEGQKMAPLSVMSAVMGNVELGVDSEAKELRKEICAASEQVNSFLTFGPIDVDRTNFFVSLCTNYIPSMDILNVLTDSKNDVYCDGTTSTLGYRVVSMVVLVLS